MNFDDINKEIDEYVKVLDKVADGNDFSLVALYVTDIIQNGSYVIYSSKAKGIMDVAYQTDVNEGFFVPGCVSRKKHIVPLIMGVLEN
jgi:manganese-dependent inorganic pyrophosphatase